jgi:hypothetical protein
VVSKVGRASNPLLFAIDVDIGLEEEIPDPTRSV